MNSNWLNKIRQHQATPPQGAWKNIAKTLDEEETKTTGFAARLAEFETTAPVSAAKNIFTLLDTTEQPPFTEKLYNYEAEVPQTAWPNIINDLDKAETKVIAIGANRKLPPVYLRVAAAVGVITLLSISIWLLNRQQGTEVIAGDIKKNLPQNNTTGSNNSAEKLVAANTKETATTTTAASVKPASGTAPALAYIQHSQTEALAQNPIAFTKEKLQNSNGETPQDVTLINNTAANSYFTITGPDGQPVRVSAKLAGFINYLNNDNLDTKENIEIIIQESSKWRATFAAWKQKMINNSIAPSLTNFMDIIELSNVLEEKK